MRCSPPYTRQIHTVIITTFTINHPFTFSLQTQNTPLPQVFSSAHSQILTGLISWTPGRTVFSCLSDLFYSFSSRLSAVD